MVLNFTKTILNTAKFHKQLKELLPSYTVFSRDGADLSITFSIELNQDDQDLCSDFVENFVDYTSVDQLEAYLDDYVNPFIKSLINTFKAENISNGITQQGKTGHVLSLFTKKYPVPSEQFENSLKDSFDTGSLYISIDIIEYIRDNSSEFEDLDPFVTDDRLLAMKNKIEVFLGIPTTP